MCGLFFLLLYVTYPRGWSRRPKQLINISLQVTAIMQRKNLFQYHYSLSDRQKAQLLWSRCVSIRGLQGTCDLTVHSNNTKEYGFQSHLEGWWVSGKVCDTLETQTALHVRSERHPYPAAFDWGAISFGIFETQHEYNLVNCLYITSIISYQPSKEAMQIQCGYLD